MTSMKKRLFLGIVVGMLAVCAEEMPQFVNAELVSAYRCDLVGPEVWTGGTHGLGHAGLKGNTATYWKSEVPFELLGKPSLGLSGMLHVVHEVAGLSDALAFAPSSADEAATRARRAPRDGASVRLEARQLRA